MDKPNGILTPNGCLGGLSCLGGMSSRSKSINRYASKTTGAGAGLGIPVISVLPPYKGETYKPPPRRAPSKRPQAQMDIFGRIKPRTRTPARNAANALSPGQTPTPQPRSRTPSRVTKPRYHIKGDSPVRMGRSKIAKETRKRPSRGTNRPRSPSEESSEEIPLRGRAKARSKSGAPRKKRGSSADSDYDPKKDRASAKRKTTKKKTSTPAASGANRKQKRTAALN
uniref:Neurofilament triplet H1-like protein n=1 Tax=Steinernema glaseri TaxID=37863 RepID=A0A1I7Z552_9BILA